MPPPVLSGWFQTFRADGHKPDAVPRRVRQFAAASRVKQAQRRAADQLPPAGGSQRVDARLLAANAHRPRGNFGARGLQPGADNAFIHAAQVREPRQEPQHKNAVVPPAVDVDDLLFGQPGVLCHKGQVGAVISAVTHRHLHQPPGRGAADRGQSVPQAAQRGDQGIGIGLQRVQRDQQRRIGGHCFHHAGQLRRLHSGI